MRHLLKQMALTFRIHRALEYLSIQKNPSALSLTKSPYSAQLETKSNLYFCHEIIYTS